MATLQSSFPSRLTKVDALAPDHWHLDESDECYFFGEYTARGGYQFGPTNQLIFNLKKGVERRGRPEWQYKEQAIRTVAWALRRAIKPEAIDSITFVPIPPSKAKSDPLYDDRMTQVLLAIRPDPPLDVRELIVQNNSVQAAHEADIRPTPQDVEAGYTLNTNLAATPPQDFIFVVDDVLTTGAHFRAAQAVLRRQFLETPIVGVFVARRIPREEEHG